MQRFVIVTPNSDTLLKRHAGFYTFPEQPITDGQPGTSAIAPEQMNRSQRSSSRFTRNLQTRDIAAFVTSWNAIMAYMSMTSVFCGFAG